MPDSATTCGLLLESEGPDLAIGRDAGVCGPGHLIVSIDPFPIRFAQTTNS